MKFNIAWANIANENVSLKYALIFTLGFGVFLGVGFLRLALKDPIVIERSCSTQMMKAVNSKPTVEEMKIFSREALMQRFSSEISANKEFLSPIELAAKKNEEGSLQKKKVSQNVIVRSVVNVKEKIYAEVDRVFMMGDSRPAYSTKLLLDIQATARTEANPYGLILNKITFLNIKGGKLEN